MPVSIPPAADPEPAELDTATRELLANAIARAITAQLGRVRISSIPPKPPSEPPRSSIRVAAKGTGKLGKWGTMAVGGLAIAGQIIVWFGKPEYASPIAQALKIIASMLVSIAGGGAPSGDGAP